MPLHLIRADPTTVQADAIVNAANNDLLQGGGVCGSIFRAAGEKDMQAACDAIGHCATGEAVITPGFRLKAKHVIHTVGPVWQGGHMGEEEALRACYRACLTLAMKHELQSVAFPLISAGIYGYPRAQAIQVAVNAISSFLVQEDAPDMDVTLVLFSDKAYAAGGQLFGRITSYLDEHDQALEYHKQECATRRPGLNVPPPCASMPMDTCPSAPAPHRMAQSSKPISQIVDWAKARFGREETFSDCLLRLIDRSGEKDSTIYHRANIDRRLFSKIRSQKQYQPSKSTVLAFCLALRLTEEESRDLLSHAGYALTDANRRDLVVAYCIRHQVYNVFDVNQALFNLDLPPLGE